jgi:flagellar motor component MotA
MIFVIFRLTNIYKDMKLTERLNVLIQAAALSQKSGILSLDEAVKAKSAIDVISSGVINQNYAAAINILIEIAVISQKKGAYSLKDAYMIYLAVEGIEGELQNEVNRINGEVIPKESNTSHILEYSPQQETSEETVITIPPQVLKKK